MMAKFFVALSMATLVAVQPVLAQIGVTTLDLGYATDEELTKALDAATDLELIMRGDWILLDEDDPPKEDADAEGSVPVEEIEYLEYLEDEAAEPEYVEEEASRNLLDNEYLRESRRLVMLAEEAYYRSDYETATIYAREASRYAQLSEEYIAQRTGVVIAAAPVDKNEGYPLPATFTVRPWAIYGDSLWSIAERPEIYGDPFMWPELFNANKHQMPNPNNPDLILPGMVLDIPSIENEVREGAWQPDRLYRR